MKALLRRHHEGKGISFLSTDLVPGKTWLNSRKSCVMKTKVYNCFPENNTKCHNTVNNLFFNVALWTNWKNRGGVGRVVRRLTVPFSRKSVDYSNFPCLSHVGSSVLDPTSSFPWFPVFGGGYPLEVSWEKRHGRQHSLEPCIWRYPNSVIVLNW